MIYSVGISSAGVAELEIISRNPARHIIATTIDEKGVEETKKLVEEKDLKEKIEVKLEDVSKPLPYSNEYFDFIYARLVLHYLDNQKLENTLKEIYRVLKAGSIFYLVVRSDKCDDNVRYKQSYFEKTGITTIFYPDQNVTRYRRFHNIDSITEFLTKAGFTVSNIEEYSEQLYIDYSRTKVSNNIDILIQVTAKK
jgi:SAM-dependent methyltransferase